MLAWLEISMLLVELALLAAVARTAAGVLGALLYVQAGYWAIGYVVRPTLLLVVRPQPGLGDPIADPRLAIYGYEAAIAEALRIAVAGIGIYLVVVILAVRLARGRAARSTTRLSIRTGHAVVLLAIGWGFRLAFLATGNTGVQTVAGLAAIAVGALVLFSPNPYRPWMIIGILLSEFAWSYLTTSKTPAMAFALWFVIRILLDRKRVKRYLVVAAAIGLVAFFAIQSAKVEQGRLTSSVAYADAYPLWARPVLPLIARFDALQPATDAWLAGPGSWLGPLEASGQFLTSLIPQFLVADVKPLAGYQWGAEVRVQSLNVSAGANLAEGVFSEGWVIFGWSGVVVGSILLALATWATAGFLTSRHHFAVFLGLALTSAPLLFERGVLGIGEGLGKGLQVALIATLLVLFLRLRIPSREAATSRATVTAGRA